MIRKAKYEDLDAILDIVREVTILMQADGNDQWNSSYPVYEDFYNDIMQDVLFVDSENNGMIRSFICLNEHQPPEYSTVKWKQNKQALTIHRMAVNPKFHGMGLAKKLLLFVETRAKDLELNYIRTDTCSRNTVMKSLFKKFKYDFTGKIYFPSYKYEFYCYEKILIQKEP